jgi:hypothetical protein
MNGAASSDRPLPLYLRALQHRIAERRSYLKAKQAKENRGARSRYVLWRLLDQCKAGISLVEIHTWSRDLQGRAYLWAIDHLDGRENNPQPWRE